MTQAPSAPVGAAPAAGQGSAAEVFLVFLRLGLTAFGGPVAHLAYFRDEIIQRRRWLSEAAYADLVALCQVLPGPASSQTGMGLGLARAGWAGLVAAWLGFTLPSAATMTLAAFGLGLIGHGAWQTGLVGGLKAAAVIVVAQAVWGMARSLWPDRRHATLGLLAAGLVVLWPLGPLALPWGQVAALVLGGAAGALLPAQAVLGDAPRLPVPVRRRTALVLLALFAGLLAGLPILAAGPAPLGLALADSLYRAGALVFGGGHVVLPLLQGEVVAPGWVTPDAFLAGYGVAQAMPGPLFTFASYLGAAAGLPGGPVAAGALAALGTVMIFLPGGLLLTGALPFWDAWRRRAGARAVLAGVNAAVVGLLLAALYDPVITAAVHGPGDVALVLLAALLLMIWKLPPWLAVATTGAAGALASLL